MFKSIKKDSFYYGAPVILMTTLDIENDIENDIANITPISSSWTLGNSVVIGLGKTSKGLQNIKSTKEFTLNLVSDRLWDKVEAIAKTTGNKIVEGWKKDMGYSYCEDKFSLGGFTRERGETVKVPRIIECPIQIEVSAKSILERDEYYIVEGEIKNILVDDSILTVEEYIIVEKWKPLIYKFRSYTTTKDSLGKNFRFDEKI